MAQPGLESPAMIHVVGNWNGAGSDVIFTINEGLPKYDTA